MEQSENCKAESDKAMLLPSARLQLDASLLETLVVRPATEIRTNRCPGNRPRQEIAILGSFPSLFRLLLAPTRRQSVWERIARQRSSEGLMNPSLAGHSGQLTRRGSR